MAPRSRARLQSPSREGWCEVKISDYNIPNLKKLLMNATKDTDACSITLFGENRKEDAEFAVIVVKGKEQTKLVAHMLETMKLYTPGKPIVSPNQP